jgi:DnaJ-domain-containing protein 1
MRQSSRSSRAKIGAINAPVDDAHAGAASCEWPACAEAATHRAPRSRSDLGQYVWFCLNHVRQYNAAWNYYEGMSESEVEADIRRDTVWQRRTWPFGAAIGRFGARPRFTDGFATFGDEGEPRRSRVRSVAEEAMTVLDLEPPVTLAAVKSRYKELVKRYHPDVTGGDKVLEERFKEISAAYRTVVSSLAT